MFVGRAQSIPKREHLKDASLGWAPALLENIKPGACTNKHSSLLQYGKNYAEKSLIVQASWSKFKQTFIK